jgi:hypothetical protein
MKEAEPLLGLEPEDLDGHTLDQLADYLERARTPTDRSIENSPACQIALAALERLHAFGTELLEADAVAAPPTADTWIADALSSISLDARAGRSIPLTHGAPGTDAHVTEGAIRGLIRATGDEVPGVLVGRVRLLGEVERERAEVGLELDVHVRFGVPIPAAMAVLRRRLLEVLPRHASFSITRIDIRVRELSDVPTATAPIR